MNSPLICNHQVFIISGDAAKFLCSPVVALEDY